MPRRRNRKKNKNQNQNKNEPNTPEPTVTSQVANDNSASHTNESKTVSRPIGPGHILGSNISTLEPGQRKNLLHRKTKLVDIAAKERMLRVLQEADQAIEPKLARMNSKSSEEEVVYWDQSDSNNTSPSSVLTLSATSANPFSNDSPQSSSSPSSTIAKQADDENHEIQSSLSPSSASQKAGAAAAEAAKSRMKAKEPRTKTMIARKDRTMNLLFGDGLVSSQSLDSCNMSNESCKLRAKKAKHDKLVADEKDEQVSVADGCTAEAALKRMETKCVKPNPGTKMQKRRQRTVDLLHGDGLKGDNYYESSETKQTDASEESSENEGVKQVLEVMEQDAKAKKQFLKIVNDIGKGKTMKVNQSKIDDKIVHALLMIGFDQVQMENKKGEMTEYLVCNENAWEFVLRFL